jgi:hypothetical protein
MHHKHVPNCGMVDVTASPFFADKYGRRDATIAIRTAIEYAKVARRIVFMPAGVFIVSDTLVYQVSAKTSWGAERNECVRLCGEGSERTFIYLQDRAFGTSRKAVVSTISSGWSNVGYTNSVAGLAIHVGGGNPGAIGLDFNGSNCAAVRDVSISAAEGSGWIGYRLSAGPSLTQNLKVTGFSLGVLAHLYGSQSAVLEDVTVRGQCKAGIVCREHPISILNLKSENAVEAVVVEEEGSLVLINADLVGGAANTPAIRVKSDDNMRSYLFARGVRIEGYGAGVFDQRAVVGGGHIKEYVSGGVFRTSEAAALHSLNLPIRRAPGIGNIARNEWASVEDFGAVGDGIKDDSGAFQCALDSGARGVYACSGHTYNIAQTVMVRGDIELIDFRWAFLRPSGAFDGTVGQPLFRVAEGRSPNVVLRRCWIRRMDGRKPYYFIEHATARTLVLQDIFLHRGSLYFSSDPKGHVFMENVTAKTRGVLPTLPTFLFRGVRAWVRQLNSDGGEHVVNEGGILWILGFKTEDLATAFSTTQGGSTEILGGHIHSNRYTRPSPIVVNDGSRVSAVLRVNRAKGYDIKYWAKEVREGATQMLEADQTPTLKRGRMLPLYVGH